MILVPLAMERTRIAAWPSIPPEIFMVRRQTGDCITGASFTNLPRKANFRRVRSEVHSEKDGELALEVRLQLPPPFHRLQHGDLIGVLNIASHWDAHRDPCHLHPDALQLLR